MRKRISEISIKAVAAVIITGGVMAFMVAAADKSPAADLAQGVPVDQSGGQIYACGQDVSRIVLFDDEGKPTIPARTPFYTCITGSTLLRDQIPPPPEYCCH